MTTAPGNSGQGTLLIGRSLLASPAAKQRADSVNRFLASEDELDRQGRGILDEDSEQALGSLGATVGIVDVLAGSLAGLNDHLLGFGTDLDPSVTGDPLPERAPQLVRSGRIRLTRLRVVGAFGRLLDLTGRLASVQIADPWPSPTPSGARPRPGRRPPSCRPALPRPPV
jgi:hypothetical protein